MGDWEARHTFAALLGWGFCCLKPGRAFWSTAGRGSGDDRPIDHLDQTGGALLLATCYPVPNCGKLVPSPAGFQTIGKERGYHNDE